MSFNSAPIIDHTGISVSDYVKAKVFYGTALAPLGIALICEFPASMTGSVDVAGFGGSGGEKAEFWLHPGKKVEPPMHFAFRAANRAEVDAFYKAALAAGGRDNGGPGLRTHYHADYYGAFVLDPDGNNIEAVCHLAA